MRVELDSVDVDQGQINVKTDDGVVPIDSLSQGTSSLLCWVGVLLHRLYEVHGAERTLDFSKLPGVVMIDEIDTHMHPLWQRLLVGRLRKLFPRCAGSHRCPRLKRCRKALSRSRYSDGSGRLRTRLTVFVLLSACQPL
jgi:hypothetical protein